MTNKELYTRKVKALGYSIGCYDKLLDEVSNYTLKKILAVLDQEYHDIEITINRKKYVAEISTVDTEKDISIKTKAMYKNQYGLDEELYKERLHQ